MRVQCSRIEKGFVVSIPWTVILLLVTTTPSRGNLERDGAEDGDLFDPILALAIQAIGLLI